VQKVRDYLLYLSQERHLAWKSCNTIRHGLRLFYQVTLNRLTTEYYFPCAKEPSRLPETLGHEELLRLFTVTTNRKHRALLMTTYAAGLRASEVTHLRVTDIDSARMCIRVEQGKGRQDRDVPLPPRPLIQLREYWRQERPPRWLFPDTQIDRPMSRDAAWHIYVKARERAGVTKAGGIHLLRLDLIVKVLADPADGAGVGLDGLRLQALELQVFEVGLVEAVEGGCGSGRHGRNLSLCLGVFPLGGGRLHSTDARAGFLRVAAPSNPSLKRSALDGQWTDDSVGAAVAGRLACMSDADHKSPSGQLRNSGCGGDRGHPDRQQPAIMQR
jgi:hypothetical protein